jgi:thiamine pyrophosphate-dependent acetolactate synthase large subunit-like protein
MRNKPDIRDIVYYGNEVNKEIIKETSLALLNDIDEGHMHPLQVAAQFKFIEDVITNVKEELRQRVISEQSKYGKDAMTYHGATFDIKEAGVKYDYSQCDDTIWNDLKQQLDALNDKMKEREAFLKTLKERFTYINESTGEIITLYPPQKKSTTTYSITWKKE